MVDAFRRRRISALVIGSSLAACTFGFAGPAAAAPHPGSAVLDPVHGILRVRGTQGDDAVTVARTQPKGQPMIGVDFGDDGSFEELFPEAQVKQIRLYGRDGKDRLKTAGVPATIEVTVDGGRGSDSLVGGDGAEQFYGGSGDDVVVPGRGNDTVWLGSGDDTFGWNPGDNNDRVEGQSGYDKQLFLGAGVDESIEISNNHGRVRFSRDVGGVTLDLNGIEALDTDLVTGRDVTDVGNLRGTDVRRVANRLGNNPGSQGRVVVHGTSSADHVTAVVAPTAQGATATVRGLPARVSVDGAGPEDELDVRLGRGDDELVATNPAGLIAFSAAGQRGADHLSGGDAAETFVGGSGSDVVDGGKGNDVVRLNRGHLDQFIWEPGDGSDSIDGGSGRDVLVFRGAPVAEKFAVSKTGRNESRFTRDVGGVTMSLRAVEGIDLTADGGADRLDVGDLSGSGLKDVSANLSGVAGSPNSDGAVDTVGIDGTDRADQLKVSGDPSSKAGYGNVRVSGLPTPIKLTRVEPTDSVTLKGRGGNDVVDTTALRQNTVQFNFIQ